jgi:APA family basic amino acid/polyamine antiporter
MGELFAVVSAACLSLEYIVASAAVSRSWGDKCVVWLTEELDAGHWAHDYLDGGSTTFNPLALLLSATTVGLLLAGVKESKAATNFFTSLKLIVVSVMIFGSLYYVKPSNWTPFAPYGVGGVVRGGELGREMNPMNGFVSFSC